MLFNPYTAGTEIDKSLPPEYSQASLHNYAAGSILLADHHQISRWPGSILMAKGWHFLFQQEGLRNVSLQVWAKGMSACHLRKKKSELLSLFIWQMS